MGEYILGLFMWSYELVSEGMGNFQRDDVT